MSDKKNDLAIAAIDFGTTYSGYAYSFRHTLQGEPLQVYGNTWMDSNGVMTTQKAPTTVLFNPEGEFDSFGFEAEEKYADLVDDDVHHGWKYFKHFKMKQHGRTRLRRDMKLTDDQGNQMRAIDVFAAVIKFLKDQLFEKIGLRCAGITETEMYWVITVPAIWQYSAKQFMKEASIKAGIPTDQFTFALEPEAAAIFCKQYEASKCVVDGVPSIKSFAPGSQFMVIDMGGGTIDITVSEVQSDGTLKELYPPSGGPWGGTLVDQDIYKFLESKFGSAVWKRFKSEQKLDFIELAIALESKKRQCKLHSSNDVRIKLPIAMFKSYKEIEDVKLQKDLRNGQFAQTSKIITTDKIRVQNSEFVKMFERAKQLVLEHLNEILALPELRNVSSLMMVGGFSESPIMHKAVKDAFPHKHVIIPEEAGTVVMKGAVLYGFNRKQILSRKLPFSYGISTAVPFDSKKHNLCRKFVNGFGEERVDDVFHEFIKKGQTVDRNSKIEHSFGTPREGEATVEVYQTPADTLADPSFTFKPEFERIGELKLYPGPGRQLIDVTMAFGDTDLEVEAREHGTNNKVKALFDFLL